MSVSYKHIANEAGVSVTTVHRVITGSNKEIWPSAIARAELIRNIAKKHGFRPNGAARAMRSKKTDIIGVVLRNRPGTTIMDTSIFEMLCGISATLEAQGYMLNLVRISDNFDAEEKVPRAFQEKLLDGTIIIGDIPEKIYGYIRRSYGRHVFLETNYYADSNCIRRDEEMSAKLAIDCLLAHGRERLFYLGPQPESEESHFSEKIRLETFIRYLSGLGVDYEVIRSIDRSYGGFRELLASLKLPDKKIGFIAYDATFAGKLICESLALGLIPGRDFGLAVCDAPAVINSSWPYLSRSMISRYDIGADAAQMLLEMIEEQKNSMPSRMIVPRFIEGRTA